MKAKLKERLDVFSDAIIAILITIMVLELPVEIHGQSVHYAQLFYAVGIYLVSFCFIANLWYQHAVIFNEAKTVPNRIVVLDLLFLFLLSLMPTFTRLMTEATTQVTVLMYGGLSLVISLLFRWIAKTIIHEKYTDKKDMRKVYNVIYGDSYLESGLLYLGIMVLGYFWPRVALVLYIIMPIRSFISDSAEREEMDEVAKMDVQGRHGLLEMSHSDQRQFKRLLLDYTRQARRAGKESAEQKAAWQNFSHQVQQKFGISDATLALWLQQSRQRGFEPRRHQ